VADPRVRDRIQEDSQVDERVEHPRLWKVLLHNDDYTTQEFVVWVLESIFHLPSAEAFAIMMHVHQQGVGVAGLFTRDVAETKVKATQALAEQHEYPLLVTIEPDSNSQDSRE
jgi:ATP-dependent Clp protease adaptor protein ClpS